jgi:hypothetical protein
MAFKSVKEYNPYQSKMDPRMESSWAINSNHMVMVVTHHKTYNDMIRAGQTIADLKILGLVSNHAVSESTNIFSTFEIGNKRQLMIPGKTAGRLSLSSDMIESVNLLGSIYETIVEGYKKDPNLAKAMANFDSKVMYHPELNETYSEGSDQGSGLDINNRSTDIMDPNTPFYQYGSEEEKQRLADAEKDRAEDEKTKGTNQGAILLSIGDLRMKVKFGLCFLLFQNSKRLVYSSVEGDLKTKSPFPKPEDFDFDSSIAFETYDEEDVRDLGDKYTNSFRILGGVFFENCLVTDYSRSINTEQSGPNYIENLNISFAGTKNLQAAKKRENLEVTKLA